MTSLKKILQDLQGIYLLVISLGSSSFLTTKALKYCCINDGFEITLFEITMNALVSSFRFI